MQVMSLWQMGIWWVGMSGMRSGWVDRRASAWVGMVCWVGMGEGKAFVRRVNWRIWRILNLWGSKSLLL